MSIVTPQRRNRGWGPQDARRASPAGPALALGVLALLAPAAGAAPTWTETTAQSGIVYQEAGEIHLEPEPHQLPDLGWPGFPEIMGGGACWVDVDNDGFEDLYIVNQRYNPLNPAYGDWALGLDTRNRLYINQGDGTYRDATDGSGADAHAFGYGCSAADYDADGCVDLFAANFGPSYLYRGHCDGTFTNVTSALGPVGVDGTCGDYACMSTSSGWADYDRDGDIDLYVDNYVETFLDDNERGPIDHIAQYNFLLRNNGDGSFSEVAHQVGAQGYHEDLNGSKSLGVAWFDYNRDGWPDIYVANDETPNNLFHNNGDGTFTERAAEARVNNTLAGMGLSAGDYDNDGWPDLFFTHYEFEKNGFYRNLGDGTFEDRSGEDDQVISLNRTGWGTRFVDYDRDGWLDIILANGHTEWFLDTYDQDIQVFRNEPEASPDGPGDRRWVDVSESSGLGYGGPMRVYRGLAFGDHDLDGDVDLFGVPNANETAVLIEGSGVTNRWLYLQLRQPGMNREALGAVVTLQAGGLTQVREHYPGHAYLSQNSMLMEFGLGSAAKADEVSIAWPDGTTTLLHDLPADRVVRVVRGVPGFVTDTLAPRTTTALAGEGQHGWFRGPVVASVAAQDLAVGPASGVVGTEYRVGSGAGWSAYQGPLTFTAEGVHELQARSRDAVGNQEPPRPQPVRIDLTPPVPTRSIAGTQGLGGWWVTSATVSLGSTDPLSGPGPVRYRLDGGAWQDYAAPFVLEEGVHVVEYVASDLVGNEAAPVAFEVRVDTTPPELAADRPAPGAIYAVRIPFQLPGGPAVIVTDGAQPFALRASAGDATSGVAFVRFALDGKLLAADPQSPYQASWRTSDSTEGLHLLTLTATDGAGNAQEVEVRVLLVSLSQASVVRTLAEGPSLVLGDLMGLDQAPPPVAGMLALPLLALRRRR